MNVRLFTPDIYVKRIVDVPVQFLRDRGRKGLLLDMDGTLKDFHDIRVAPGVVDWMDTMRSSGIRLCLLSNGRENRIAKLASDLDVPFVAQAVKPFPFGCRKAVRMLGLTSSEVAFAGDQLLADHLAGRLAGLLTILVRPTSWQEPWFTKLKRPLESIFTRNLVYDTLTQDELKNAESTEACAKSEQSRVEL